MNPLPKAKLQEILLNAYLLGENSKEINVIEVIEDMKQQLIRVIDTTNER